MVDKKQQIKEIIQKNPNLSSNDILSIIKGTKLAIRRQTFQEIFREIRNLPEPTIKKREVSIPIKFRTPKTLRKIKEKAKERIKQRLKLKEIPKKEVKKEIEAKEKIKEQKLAKEIAKEIRVKVKKERIPFEKTKFGKMTKRIQTVFRISERNAIIRLRKLLKIPRTDFNKLRQKDFDILVEFGY